MPPDESAASRQERQYRTLLLLEHVAAELLPDAGHKTTGVRAGQCGAFRADLALSWAWDSNGAGMAPLQAMALQDLPTLANWRMMREFNLALCEGADDPLQAFEQMLSATK